MANVTAVGNPGLRDRQKEKRRERILFAAAELFTEAGFDDAKLEDIAARAEVSVPTIYTYFASKSDLLLGILEIDKELMAERVETILADPPADPIDAVTTLGLSELAGGYDASRKRVWREISAAALRGPPERRDAYLRLQARQFEALRRLFVSLRRNALIARSVDERQAASLAYAVTRNNFRLFIMREDLTLADLEAMVRQDIKALFRGFQPSTPPRRSMKLIREASHDHAPRPSTFGRDTARAGYPVPYAPADECRRPREDRPDHRYRRGGLLFLRREWQALSRHACGTVVHLARLLGEAAQGGSGAAV
jgi:AcrR family transcriptional regulator